MVTCIQKAIFSSIFFSSKFYSFKLRLDSSLAVVAMTSLKSGSIEDGKSISSDNAAPSKTASAVAASSSSVEITDILSGQAVDPVITKKLNLLNNVCSSHSYSRLFPTNLFLLDYRQLTKSVGRPTTHGSFYLPVLVMQSIP